MEMMMWERPEMNEVVFPANAYCSSCGEGGTTYWFECNAPSNQLYYYDYMNLEDYKSDKDDPDSPLNWTTDRWAEEKNKWDYLGNLYHACGQEHKASTGEGFYWGFIDLQYGYDSEDGGEKGRHDAFETVIVWRGSDGKQGHATKNLDVSTWEIAKS
ncbi:MAG: hypothetical protein E7321_10650 [Clostridiales bacterium]|nr:hypothetical protein [Clostridiales bacterium]